MVLRKSGTFLGTVAQHECFGELGFYCFKERICSAMSKEVTEIIFIDREDMMSLAAETCSEGISVFHNIKASILDNKFGSLGIDCYICHSEDHISIECPEFRS